MGKTVLVKLPKRGAAGDHPRRHRFRAEQNAARYRCRPMATITVPGILEGASVDSFDISSPQSLSVTRDVDSASERLASACAEGTLVGNVTIESGATFVFTGSIISAYQVDGMKETVTFNFQKMSDGGSH
jgi:hypothetical protein